MVGGIAGGCDNYPKVGFAERGVVQWMRQGLCGFLEGLRIRIHTCEGMMTERLVSNEKRGDVVLRNFA